MSAATDARDAAYARLVAAADALVAKVNSPGPVDETEIVDDTNKMTTVAEQLEAAAAPAAPPAPAPAPAPAA